MRRSCFLVALAFWSLVRLFVCLLFVLARVVYDRWTGYCGWTLLLILSFSATSADFETPSSLMLPNGQMDGSKYELLLQQQELMSNDLTSERCHLVRPGVS